MINKILGVLLVGVPFWLIFAGIWYGAGWRFMLIFVAVIGISIIAVASIFIGAELLRND